MVYLSQNSISIAVLPRSVSKVIKRHLHMLKQVTREAALGFD